MYTPFYLPEHLVQTWALALMQNPRLLQEGSAKLLPALHNVYQNTLKSISRSNWPLAVEPSKMDRRFDHPLWRESPYFRGFHQTYLAFSEWLLGIARDTPMVDSLKKELIFFLKQTLDAYAPSNFPTTNPEICLKYLEEGHEPLAQGIQRLFQDWNQLGPQEFFLSLTRPKGFKVGDNLATTPGQVVFRNELVELIQYEPVTPSVYKEPLLIVPPWINKYYVFDLIPEKSFVDWARKQGFTVFILSWINPDAKLKDTSFYDYLEKGLLKTLDAACDISGASSVHGMGYCLGGNLLAIGAAHLKKTKPKQLASISLLATIGDFNLMEDLGLFLNADHVKAIKSTIEEQGVMDGYTLGLIFSFLRANNLIWSALVNKYFLDKEPFPLDFLHWNADPSSLPSRMYLDFLEEIVQKNSFLEQDGINLSGHHLSFEGVETPCFVMGAQKDHIAPWRSCFPFFKSAKGRKTFILATAGHIAGVINSPTKNKYSYFHLERLKEGIEAEDWAQKAIEVKGSWWPFWQDWITRGANEKVSPPSIGSNHYPPQDKAPGRYVLITQKERPLANQKSPTINPFSSPNDPTNKNSQP